MCSNPVWSSPHCPCLCLSRCPCAPPACSQCLALLVLGCQELFFALPACSCSACLASSLSLSPAHCVMLSRHENSIFSHKFSFCPPFFVVAQNDLGLLCYRKKVELFPHFSFFISPQIFGRSCCGHLLERFLWTGLLRDLATGVGSGFITKESSSCPRWS